MELVFDPLPIRNKKQLIPVANKSVLFYAIEDVIEAGADEVGIIVGMYNWKKY